MDNFNLKKYLAENRLLKEEIDISDLGDFDGTLGELASEINSLIDEYGPNSRIRLDAGHNNVSFMVTPKSDI